MALQFQKHAPEYLARTIYRRSRDDVEFIAETARSLELDPTVENYLLVPVHVTERCAARYIAAICPALLTTRVNVLFFINGSEDELTQSEFLDRSQQISRELAEVTRDIQTHIAIYQRRYSERPSMGRIRGTMCEIVIAWSLGTSQLNPMVIFNDIDTLQVSPSYFHSIFRRLTAPGTKLVVGPVLYGYHGRILIGVQDQTLHMPELYLFNCINQSILKCARSGAINYERRVWPEGASLAFPLSSYCAVGGFDWSRETGEDDDFGRACHRYNPTVYAKGIANADSVYCPDDCLTVEYAPESWLVTDPRRLVHAINSGLTGIEAWADGSFVTRRGSELALEDLALEYCQNESLLQLKQIRMADERNDPTVRETVLQKIRGLASRITEFDCRIRTVDQETAVLVEAGVARRGVSVSPGDTIHASSWRHLPIIQDLVRLGLK